MSAIRVLELRSANGPGGGPDKTILAGAARHDPACIDVTVCYLRGAGDEAFDLDRRAIAGDVQFVQLPERRSWDWTLLPRLRALIRSRRIDIVHSHDYKTDLIAWLLGRRREVVPLATAHGWTGHSPRERHVYYPVDKLVLRRFPHVIAVSTEIRNELVRRGADPSRIEVVLNGVDERRFRRDDALVTRARAEFHVPLGGVVVGSVGRLEPQKRFDLLLHAFAALVRERPEAVLLVAGDGGERGSLEALSRSLGLSRSCRFIGHCDDIRRFYHALDVFVQSSEYEGTPNVVLEAMALEVPVVATDAGGTAEVLRPGIDGVIVRRGDAEVLTSAMRGALRDPVRAVERARSARRQVETELSFDARVARLDAIYQRLAASARVSAPLGAAACARP